jgi:hypothetical protein
MKFRKSLISALVLAITFGSGMAIASVITSPQPTIKICITKKSGALRQSSSCKASEVTIDLPTLATTPQQVVEKHTFPPGFGSSGQTILFPACPAYAPALTGNEVYIPESSPYELGPIVANTYGGSGQRIHLKSNNASSGSVIYQDTQTQYDTNTRLSFSNQNSPSGSALEIFLITTCAPISKAVNVSH